MPNPNPATITEELKNLDEVVDGIEAAIDAFNEGKDAVDQIEDITDELQNLTDRIESARNDPASLSGEAYTQLMTDVVMVVPKKLPIPKPLLALFEGTINAIFSLFGFEIDVSLGFVRKRFKDLVDMGTDPQEAALTASNSSVTQLYLLNWRLQGFPKIANPGRIDRVWNWVEKFVKGIVGGIFGTIGFGPPWGMGCMSILLAAFVAVSILVGLILLNRGGDGDETPATATNTSVPPTNTSVLPTNTPVPPTNTSVLPTNTPVPPTSTPVPPTSTPGPTAAGSVTLKNGHTIQYFGTTSVRENGELIFRFCVLKNGQPVSGKQVFATLGRNPADNATASHGSGTTDADGYATFSLKVKEGQGRTQLRTAVDDEVDVVLEIDIEKS